ncbi:hypothetical protein DPMN_097318 [Dreissena polymorpha]|uniref:Uncharacterized protein n=1 Tax=Dreissena polymorpha TaxID=45954 RepID=A0A9D4LBI9_DREPO|nr:hypothetical protein DPMN_097318 [Dreissena polymorpha]
MVTNKTLCVLQSGKPGLTSTSASSCPMVSISLNMVIRLLKPAMVSFLCSRAARSSSHFLRM